MVTKKPNWCGFGKEWNLLRLERQSEVQMKLPPSWSKKFQVRLINSLKTPHIWNYTLKEMDGMKKPGGLLEEWEDARGEGGGLSLAASKLDSLQHSFSTCSFCLPSGGYNGTSWPPAFVAYLVFLSWWNIFL